MKRSVYYPCTGFELVTLREDFKNSCLSVHNNFFPDYDQVALLPDTPCDISGPIDVLVSTGPGQTYIDQTEREVKALLEVYTPETHPIRESESESKK